MHEVQRVVFKTCGKGQTLPSSSEVISLIAHVISKNVVLPSHFGKGSNFFFFLPWPQSHFACPRMLILVNPTPTDRPLLLTWKNTVTERRFWHRTAWLAHHSTVVEFNVALSNEIS